MLLYLFLLNKLSQFTRLVKNTFRPSETLYVPTTFLLISFSIISLNILIDKKSL